MADTTFTDYVSPIVASWLNDVNVTAYRGVNNNITTTYSYFSFNGVEKVRITSTGEMGIGVTFPSGKLDIYNGLRFTPSNPDVGKAAIVLKGAYGGGLTLIDDTSLASLYCVSGRFSIGTGSLSGVVERITIDSFGNISVTGSGSFGYGSGSGGTVTQVTDKTTTVTLNKPTGRITMVNSALSANTTVKFVLNNSLIGSSDNLIVSLYPSFPVENYQVWSGCSAGFAYICVRNITAGSLSDALILNFSILKGATT